MSRPNIEKIRKSIEAYNRGDRELALKDAHPEVVWDMAEFGAMSTGQSHSGPDGVQRFWNDVDEHFESFRLEPGPFRAEGDFVLFPVQMIARGRGSGVDVNIDLYCVARFHEGLIVRVSYMLSEGEALEAARIVE